MNQVDLSLLQPRSAIELFRRGVTECIRDGWSAWFTAAAILLAPSAISVAGQCAISQTGAMELMQSLQKGAVNPETLDPGELFRAIGLLAGVGLATGILSVMGQYAGGVALARMIAERALGHSFNAFQAWDFVLGRIAKVISGGLVLMLVFAGAAILGQIPGGIITGIIAASSGPMQPGQSPPLIMQIVPVVTMLPVILAAAVYLVAMMAVTAIENLGGFPALGRSYRLAGGHFKHVLGTVALAGLVFGVPSMAVGMLGQSSLAEQLRQSLGSMMGTLVFFGAGAMISLVLSPFMLTIQAVIYLDLRSRLRDERFTAYELALDIGGELPEGVTAPVDEDDWSPPPVSSSSSKLPLPPITS